MLVDELNSKVTHTCSGSFKLLHGEDRRMSMVNLMRDTELAKILDAKELSQVSRYCKAAVVVLNEDDSDWEGSFAFRHDINIFVDCCNQHHTLKC